MSSFRRSFLAVLLGVLAACDSPTKPEPSAAFLVVVGPGSAVVDAGGTQQFAAVVTDEEGRALEGLPVVWEVLDTMVATVSATGLVTAKPNALASDRATQVRATVSGKSGQSSLSVRPSVVATLDLLPYTPVLVDGAEPILVVQARDAAGNLLLGRAANFVSRDPATASVSNSGVLRPVAFLEGGNRSTRIVARIGALSDSISVSVAPSALNELLIFPAQPFMQPGWTKTLRAEGRTPGGSVVAGVLPTYTSSNPSIASVTPGGTVTSFAGVTGTTQVIADFGGFADTVTLTVDACGAAPAGTYPLEVRYYGPNLPSTSVQDAFNCAAARIGAIIRAPLSVTNLTGASLTNCTGESTTLSGTSAGLIIYAKVDSIDGVGQTLGQAGPCFVRGTSRLPVVGLMEFDDDDLANLQASGRLLAVIMHEMLHVVGIGSIWREPALNIWTGDVPNPGFLGARARISCVDDHGGAGICVSNVPIEDCTGVPGGRTCGDGTRLGHWREATFDTELMTGYVSLPGVRNPFSRMTIQALADLGYTTDPDQSNDYVIPSPTMTRLMEQSAGSGLLRMPAPRLPTHEIDPMGRMRRIFR